MKIKILTLLFVIGFGFLTSCNNDDDNSTQVKTISGTWNLKNVSGGLQSVNVDYSRGDVKWSFNQTNNTLIVENNVTTEPKVIYAGFDSGTYNYEIQQGPNNQILFIDEIESGGIILTDFFILNQNITMSGSGADGFVFKFER